jgi:hypothetical protein
MNSLTTLKKFIVKVKVHKVLTMHTMQVTQAMSYPEVKTKIVFDL